MNGFRVMFYQDGWKLLTDTYESYNRAATIATALENRGLKTSIIEIADVGEVLKAIENAI